jgi:type IV pilus assembly protein PilV
VKNAALTGRKTIPDGRNGGFTLVEVMVALFVLGVGLLGLAMLQTTGMRFTTNSYSRTQATYLAYDIIEKMRANLGAFTAGSYDVLDFAAANAVISNYASCKSSSCDCETNVCSDSALAQYDLGQWYERQRTLIPGSEDVAGLASQPRRATIERNGNKATVTVVWLETERNTDASVPADQQYGVKSQVWEADIFK